MALMVLILVSAALFSFAFSSDSEVSTEKEEQKQELRFKLIAPPKLHRHEISSYEMELMARLIYKEAWYDIDNALAISQLVKARIASPKFADSIEEVIFSPGQFCTAENLLYWNWDTGHIPYWTQEKIDLVKKEISAAVCDVFCKEESIIGGDPLFYSHYEIPMERLANNLYFLARIGDHIFYGQY